MPRPRNSLKNLQIIIFFSFLYTAVIFTSNRSKSTFFYSMFLEKFFFDVGHFYCVEHWLNGDNRIIVSGLSRPSN